MENKGQSALEKSILATICYFDVFDYPLTLMEIWKWLIDYREETGLLNIRKELENSAYLLSKIQSKQGHYFLKGREEIVAIRKERYEIAENKFQKTLKVSRILRHFPFIKMISVCNTLAFSNSHDNSDIDLFIITDQKRVWQTRFWVTGFFKLFKMRPTAQKTKDTFCASFFVDEDSLKLENLALSNDIYLHYWINQVYPVYDEGIYRQFLSQNSWIRSRLTNSIFTEPALRRRISGISNFKKIITAIFGLIPESVFKKYQLNILPKKLKEMANKDSRVVIGDQLLKFHDNDRRELFLKLYQNKLNSVQ